MVEDEIVIREMKEGDRREVAELICISTNYSPRCAVRARRSRG